MKGGFMRVLLTFIFILAFLKNADEEECFVNYKNCVLASLLYLIWRV